jgi:hypothetical protein
MLTIAISNHQNPGEFMTSSFLETPMPEQIEELVGALGSADGATRQEAREKLIHLGETAAPYLRELLEHPDDHVRWEAAKALIAIKDTKAIPALVEALMDERSEIRWLAGEALIAQRERAIKPLLQGLVKHFGSADFRQSAYHVLHVLERHNLLHEEEAEVLEALRSLASESNAAWAAERALEVSRR